MKLLSAACLLAAMSATPALAGADWGKVCASYGLTRGTADFKDCVAKMSDADKATGGTLMQDDSAPPRRQAQADFGRQQAQMQAGNNSNCVTTVHGSNRSTVCGPAQAQPAPQREVRQQGGPSPQQPASLVGTWSAGNPQSGLAFAFNPNGTFVSVMGGGGTAQRLWGNYRVTPLQGSAVRVDFQLGGYAPRRMCAQVIGGAMACRPYRPIYDNSTVISFASPSRFDAHGTQFRRDPSPYLLQIQVPDTLQKSFANTAPPMRQPVMPTLHPYQTPGGAGSVAAMRYDDEHQQPYRTCSVNGGSVYTTQDGVQHCSN